MYYRGGPHARCILDARVVLGEPYQGRVYNLPEADTLPVAAVKLGVASFGRWVVDQVLEGLLREGGLS